MLKNARLLASVKFLRRLERKLFKAAPAGVSASALRKILNKKPIQRLYDHQISPLGGWTELATTMTYDDFDNELGKRLSDLDIVVDLLSFRFRYMDHGGIKRYGNIIHGHVFRWWQGRAISMPSVSRDSIQKRWKNNKLSSVFAYVAVAFPPQLSINPLTSKRFTPALIAEANNREKLRRYFGMCRYVASTLSDRSVDRCFPSEEVLPPVRPETSPIEPEALAEFLRTYPALYNEYQTGPVG